MNPLPTLYIPHGGGPCFFMDWNPPHTWDKLAGWLGKLGESLDRPKAIVARQSSRNGKMRLARATPIHVKNI